MCRFDWKGWWWLWGRQRYWSQVQTSQNTNATVSKLWIRCQSPQSH